MSAPLAGGSSASPVEQEIAPARNGGSAAHGPALVERDLQPTGAPPNGELTAQRDAPVGGQAVLEGVMMRGDLPLGGRGAQADARAAAEEDYSPGEEAALGEIEVSTFPLKSALQRHRWLRLPIIRGVVALGGSLAIGFRALEISANAQLPVEAPAPGALEAEDGGDEQEPEEIPAAVWAGTIVVALVLAIGLFFVIPVGAHEPGQAPAGLAGALLGGRGPVRTASSSATCCCSRACITCGGSSSTTAPSTRRSPASRRG